MHFVLTRDWNFGIHYAHLDNIAKLILNFSSIATSLSEWTILLSFFDFPGYNNIGWLR